MTVLHLDASPKPAAGKLKVRMLIRALTTGGAERQLIEIADHLTRRGHSVTVIVYYSAEGPFQIEAMSRGVRILDLAKRGRWDVIGFLRRLREATSADCCDVVYSMLPTSNVIASLVSKRRGGPALVWGIRSTDMGDGGYDWLGRALAWAERRLAWRADLVVVNSKRGLEFHASRGFNRRALRLVRNGVDLVRFRFDHEARKRWRAAWGLSASQPLVMLVGRHDPIKGIEIFLRAITDLEIQVAIVGASDGLYTPGLHRLAMELGVESRVRWVSPQTDMPGIFSAADVVCSASYSEGTSNVLVEACACGALVVATDVGDSAEIVGDPARMAAPRSVDELRNVIRLAVASIGSHVVRDARAPALDRYDMGRMIDDTESVLVEAVARSRHSS